MRTMPSLTSSKLDKENGELLNKMLPNKHSLVEVNPGRVILPSDYMMIGQDILDMEVLESDVWICSYPRTGSMWAQEMVWLIRHDLDYEGAKSLQQIRCPRIEWSCFMMSNHAECHDELMKGTSVDYVKHRVSQPRHIRSHLPWELLPVDMEKEDGLIKPKVIYTLRNPKDVVVSYYHFLSFVQGLRGTFEDFCELFMTDYVPLGSLWNHVLDFWKRRDDPNILFIRFEEMKSDLPAVIRKTAKFLGKTITDEEIRVLCDHLSFKNMKTNKAVNLEPILDKSYDKSYIENPESRFIRKGEVGSWKNYMSDDLSKRFDQWVQENLNGTELSFDV